MPLRPAAEILRREAQVLPSILDLMSLEQFDLPTVCTGWSVRDVIAHCGAALTRVGTSELHRFTPDDNQADVDLRRSWSIADVVAELVAGYAVAVTAIDRAGDGSLDGVGLGEWMHGGDVRAALYRPDAYTSEGSELAVALLIERSHRMERSAHMVIVDGLTHTFGVGDVKGSVETDLETFIRLTGGRDPDAGRMKVLDAELTEFVLFA